MRYVDVEETLDVHPKRYSWRIRSTGGSDEWISANHYWSSVESAITGARKWADKFNVKLEGVKRPGENSHIQKETG